MSVDNSPPEPALKENPDGFALRATPRRVVRLNRRVLIGLVGVLSGTLLVIAFWTFRPREKPEVNAQELRNVDHVARAEGLEKLPKDYGHLPKVPQLGPPIGEFGRPLLRAEQNAGLAELPETSNFAPNHADDAERSARLSEQQEAQEAAKSKVFFSLRQQTEILGKRGAEPSADGVESASDAAKAASDHQNPTSDRSRRENFLNTALDRRIYASGTLQTPRSPDEIMAGTVISAALVTGINSDLPGQMIASVTQDVYDTVSGTRLLVPQGSKLLGRYDSEVAFGQRRVQTVWTRLIMPDGSSIVLDQLPGADTEGKSGLEDKVDWHWARIFAGAAVSTLIGVGAELAAPDRLQAGEVVVATRESVQQNINDVGQQITRKNLEIQPTLTIRPGFEVEVIVNKDLILRPYGTSEPKGARS